MGLLMKVAKTLVARASADVLPQSLPFSRLPVSWSVAKRFGTDVKSLEEMTLLLNKPGEDSSPEARRQALQVEFDYFSYMGDNMPTNVTEEMWDEITHIKSAEARRHCWATLHRRELSKHSHLFVRRRMANHRLDRMLARVKEVEGEDYQGDVYDECGKNKGGIPFYLLPRINANFIKGKQEFRLSYAHNLGQNIVFDLGPHLPMDAKAESSFRASLFSIYAENRTLWEPFNIHLSNYDPAYGPVERFVDSDWTRNYLWNVSSKCFTELFPLEKIVYLTSDSPKKLTAFSHDDIYVISATNNVGSCKENLAKVKQHNLRSAQLNLDPYLVKQGGASTFSARQIFRVLKDARDTESNWPYSFRHLVKTFNSPVRWRAKYRHMERMFPILKNNRKRSFDSFTVENVDEDVDQELRKRNHMFRNERSIFKPRNKDLPPPPSPFSEHVDANDEDLLNPPSVTIDANPNFKTHTESRHFKDGPVRLKRSRIPSQEDFWKEINRMDENEFLERL